MKNEGLQFTFRTLTPEEYAAEVAADAEEIGTGRINPTTDVGYDGDDTENDDDDGDDDEDTKETSAALTAAFLRVAKGQTVKPELVVTDRKVAATPAEPEPTYSTSAAALALNSAIRKAREAREKS